MSTTPHSRYYRLPVIEVDGRTTLGVRPIPPSPRAESLPVHILVGGETIEQLAKKYYGREDLWWRIADANPAKFPLDWQPGDRVLIPSGVGATKTPRR